MASKKPADKLLCNLKKVPPFTDDDLIETIYLADLGAKLLAPNKEKDPEIAKSMRYAIACAKNMMRVAHVIEHNNALLEKAEAAMKTKFKVIDDKSKKKANAKPSKKTSKKA